MLFDFCLSSDDGRFDRKWKEKEVECLSPLHVHLEAAKPRETSALVRQCLSKPIPVLGSALFLIPNSLGC